MDGHPTADCIEHGFIVPYIQGNEQNCDYFLHFQGTTEDTKAVAYTDEVYMIPPEELSEYSLRGNFRISGIHVKGNWMVTFSLEDLMKK